MEYARNKIICSTCVAIEVIRPNATNSDLDRNDLESKP